MANRRITDLTAVTYISSSLYIPVFDPDANLDIDADGYLDNDKKIRLNDFMSVPSQSAMTWFGTGVDGDFYINTLTNEIFGPKSAGVWPQATSLVGPSGANGLQGAAGPQGPQAA